MRQSHNLKVVSSILTGGITLLPFFHTSVFWLTLSTLQLLLFFTYSKQKEKQKNSIEGNACHSHFLSCWSNSMWQSKFSSLILNFAWGEERKWLMDSPAHCQHNDCTVKQCIHYVTSILVGTCNWFSLNLLLIFARYSIELQLQTLMAHDSGHMQCSTHASKLIVICE